MVPQPIYNKDSFGVDLMESKCNWATVAPSFYLAGVAHGFIASDAFKDVTRPSSGGEPVTKSNVVLIDKWLKMNGCKVRFSIGGGAAEDGSSTITSYLMDEKTKTNETGFPVEPGIRWGNMDDIAVQNIDGSYNILGRASDSCIDKEGNIFIRHRKFIGA